MRRLILTVLIVMSSVFYPPIVFLATKCTFLSRFVIAVGHCAKDNLSDLCCFLTMLAMSVMYSQAHHRKCELAHVKKYAVGLSCTVYLCKECKVSPVCYAVYLYTRLHSQFFSLYHLLVHRNKKCRNRSFCLNKAGWLTEPPLRCCCSTSALPRFVAP